MSLYTEASSALENSNRVGGSLKSRVYNLKGTKNAPVQIYALVSQSIKWSPILKKVIEESGILALERKLSPILALLLTHDVLLSKRGVAAPKNHALTTTITKHKARLQAELTRQRIKLGYPSLEVLKEAVESGNVGSETLAKDIQRHPRWVRINKVKTSLKAELSSTFAKFEKEETLEMLMKASKDKKILYIDSTVPDLIALPPSFDLSKVESYLSGNLIIQDKASCFPAYLLDVATVHGGIIDACAAPGNKTTHLASFCAEITGSKQKNRVHAFEKDKNRSGLLERMVRKAGADKIISVHGQCDFLEANPTDEDWKDIGGILLDPSCSGSGIITRDEETLLQLPSADSKAKSQTSQSKKRKRGEENGSNTAAIGDTEIVKDEEEDLQKRLEGLASFQLTLLTHAMNFPSATRIVYSTCSIHFEENERVVMQALISKIGKRKGWRLLRRTDQVQGLKSWSIRGDKEACEKWLTNAKSVGGLKAADVAEGCIRCDKHNKEGTIGFFVAGFVRDESENIEVESESTESEQNEEEWNGFSDDN